MAIVYSVCKRSMVPVAAETPGSAATGVHGIIYSSDSESGPCHTLVARRREVRQLSEDRKCQPRTPLVPLMSSFRRLSQAREELRRTSARLGPRNAFSFPPRWVDLGRSVSAHLCIPLLQPSGTAGPLRVSRALGLRPLASFPSGTLLLCCACVRSEELTIYRAHARLASLSPGLFLPCLEVRNNVGRRGNVGRTSSQTCYPDSRTSKLYAT